METKILLRFNLISNNLLDKYETFKSEEKENKFI